jgi:hypothetical protein
MLANTLELITLQYYMNNQFQNVYTKSKTLNNPQINQIWINASTQQCHVRSTQAYCIDHNPIYFAFKLVNYVF